MPIGEPLPLEIQPGVVKSQSLAMLGSRYVESDKIHFVDGMPEKWGGWEKWNEDDQWHGIVRGLFAFTTKAGSLLAIGGSAEKLETLSQTEKADITPLQASGTLANPFSTTNASTSVTVHHVAHGLTVNQRAIYSGASAVGGITISGTYLVATVVDVDNYTVTHSAPATSTAGPGGGAAVAYEYEIAPGSDETVYGLGWGAGDWGEGSWGTERSIDNAISNDSRYWFISRYGSMVMALPSGGTLYTWDQPNNDARAEAVTNAPDARAFFMTPERYPVLLGTDDEPMRMQWPDRDDITDWTPGLTDTANTRTLQGGSKLISGTALVEGQSLIWSDSSCFRMQYTGDDLVYSTFRIGNLCGLIAPGAFVVAPGGMALWMSPTDFHLYNGAVDYIPRRRDIQRYVFDRIDTNRARKITAAYNPTVNEVVWLYASTASPDGQNDSYVAVSLDDWSWNVGTLERSDGANFEDVDSTFIMSGNDLYLYQHETGNDADGDALEAYVTTGISGGRNTLDLWGFIPDFQRQEGDLVVTFFSQDRPGSATRLEEYEQTVAVGDEIEDLHLEGRYFGITVSSNVVGGDFRMGVPLVDYGVASGR